MLLFGVWWNPLTWLSDGLEAIQGAASKALRTVFFSLSTLIYKLVISLYDLFDILCYGRILDNEVLKDLSTRIGYVLGVIMLFFVILSFVNMLLNPDTLSDKNKGAVNIIKKTILVIVMLGVSNYFFQLLYSVQRVVVQNHVVSKLLLPYEVDTEHFGGALSAELFTAFYNVSLSYIDSDGNIMGDDENVQLCQQEVYTMKEQIAEHSDFSLGDVCLNTSTTYTAADGAEREDFIIDFNWLLSVGVGIFAIYILTMYCIKVGIRMIQLAFLEIISPMAIVSYLSPKQDTMFSKWSKIYFSTYIDVFIRIAIINFSVYLIAVIFGSGTDKTFWESFEINGSNPIWTKRFSMIAMVLALLAFAKKAPELLKELVPASASKLGFGGMKMKDIFGLSRGLNVGAAVGTTAAVGLLGGAISSGAAAYKRDGTKRSALKYGLKGAFGGGLTGAFHGIDNGFKSKNLGGALTSSFREQRSRNFRAADAISQGSTFGGRVSSSAMRLLGQNTKAESIKSNISALNNYSKHFDKMKEIADRSKAVKRFKEDYENAMNSGTATAQEIQNKKNLYENMQRMVIQDAIKNDFRTSSYSGVNASELADMSTVANVMNRDYEDNKDLFNDAGIARVSSTTKFDDLKAYSGIAKSTAFRMENSDEYVKGQADDQYAFIPPDERMRRKEK